MCSNGPVYSQCVSRLLKQWHADMKQKNLFCWPSPFFASFFNILHLPFYLLLNRQTPFNLLFHFLVSSWSVFFGANKYTHPVQLILIMLLIGQKCDAHLKEQNKCCCSCKKLEGLFALLLWYWSPGSKGWAA